MEITKILLISEKGDKRARIYKYEENISRGEIIKKRLENHFGYIVNLNTLLDAVSRKPDLHNYNCIVIINQDIINITSLLEFVEKYCPETKIIILKCLDMGEWYGAQDTDQKISRLTITEPIETHIYKLIDKIDELANKI